MNDNIQSDSVEDIFEQTEIDFDAKDKYNLKSVIIIYCRNKNIPRTEDDHAVRVTLKNKFGYAYAPKRFAQAERREIKTIIDDLLERGIIRESTSSYCARLVPGKKTYD